MADATIKPDSGNDLVLSNDDGSKKIEITDSGNIEVTGAVDLQGSELILDADGDTSITADTDDQIDLKVGGSDQVSITASAVDINGNELILDADGDTSITSDTDDQIDFKTGGSDRVTIDSSGNVGIGTTSPSDLSSSANDLVIGSGSGGVGMTIYTGTGDQGQIRFADGNSGDAEYRGRVEYDHSSDTLFFGTSGLTQVQIADNGLIYGHYAGKTNVQITDDAVYSFTPTSTKGTCLIYCTDDAGDHFYSWFSFEVGSSKWARSFVMGGTNQLTTVNGTASTSNVTDGYFGSLSSSDGKLYFVNRTGMSASQSYFSIVMIGR